MFTIKNKTIYGQPLTDADKKAIKRVYKILTELESDAKDHTVQDCFRAFFGILKR